MNVMSKVLCHFFYQTVNVPFILLAFARSWCEVVVGCVHSIRSLKCARVVMTPLQRRQPVMCQNTALVVTKTRLNHQSMCASLSLMSNLIYMIFQEKPVGRLFPGLEVVSLPVLSSPHTLTHSHTLTHFHSYSSASMTWTAIGKLHFEAWGWWISYKSSKITFFSVLLNHSPLFPKQISSFTTYTIAYQEQQK